jgi:hypothetical protein
VLSEQRIGRYQHAAKLHQGPLHSARKRCCNARVAGATPDQVKVTLTTTVADGGPATGTAVQIRLPWTCVAPSDAGADAAAIDAVDVAVDAVDGAGDALDVAVDAVDAAGDADGAG